MHQPSPLANGDAPLPRGHSLSPPVEGINALSPNLALSLASPLTEGV